MKRPLVEAATFLATFAWLIGLGYSAGSAHATPVIRAPYIAPGMLQGELLAVFGTGPHTGTKARTRGRSAHTASAINDYWDGNICTSAGRCLNRTGGGRFIQMWLNSRAGAANNFWYVRYIGTVSSSQAWPFTPGSGFNTAYNGEAVVNIDNGHGLCFQDAPGEGEVQISTNTCSGSRTDNNYTWDVWSSGNRIKAVNLMNEEAASGGGGPAWVVWGIDNKDGKPAQWAIGSSGLRDTQVFYATLPPSS